MKRLVPLVLVALTVLAAANCHQVFYCKLFRLEDSSTDDRRSFSHELLDGKFGSFGNSDLYIRVVALWDSNNKELLSNTSYSISFEQRAHGALTEILEIDSVTITMKPSGEILAVQKTSEAVMIGDFIPEPRVKTMFREITIPDDVDSILVMPVVRSPGGSLPAESRSFQIPMSRYEGTVEKFGIRPKN